MQIKCSESNILKDVFLQFLVMEKKKKARAQKEIALFSFFFFPVLVQCCRAA